MALLRKPAAWAVLVLAALLGAIWCVQGLREVDVPSVTPPLSATRSSEHVPPSDLSAPRRSSHWKRSLGPLDSGDSKLEGDCQPYVDKRCYAGNVHWFDSCDHVQDIETECTAGMCEGGRCVAADWTELCTEPPEGRCEGDKVVFCDLGAVRTIDCAALGKTCSPNLHEGAGCVEPSLEPTCEPAPPRCQGETLQRCLAGTLVETNCALGGGRCSESATGDAVCLQPVDLGDERKDCGACGCEPSGVTSEEQCNGVDDDINGFIDDGVDCGPVRIDVWIGSGAYGERAINPEQLQAELGRTNQTFVESGSAIRFELGEVRDLPTANAQTLDFAQLLELHPSLTTPHAELVLPLVFVHTLIESDVPRLGLQFPSVANACGDITRKGGVKRDQVIMAISQRRSPTTLAHEIGHALGLCHTHETAGHAPIPVADLADGSEQLCAEPCSYGGDAICDTPLDHESCTYNRQTCAPMCPVELMSGSNQLPTGYAPDTSNVMSYYHSCRRRFSSEQVKVMEHTLAVRRSWARCKNGACACDWGTDVCPFGMSCRPASSDSSFACGMDGPQLPGEACRSHRECSAQSLCVEDGTRSVCVRPCGEATGDCNCTGQGPGGRAVCANDLPVSG